MEKNISPPLKNGIIKYMWHSKKSFNTMVFDGDGCIKLITTSGHKVLIDYESINILKGNRVCLSSRKYPKIFRDNKRIFIYKLICPTNLGMVVDHINGNPLDNRKSNLRPCLPIQNGRNLSKPNTNKSGYKGVTKCSTSNNYRVNIRVDKKQKHIGVYKCITDAAKAYNNAAIKYYGEFARLNKIKEELI